MRTTIQNPETWRSWLAVIVYVALALVGAAWIAGAWTVGALFDFLR